MVRARAGRGPPLTPVGELPVVAVSLPAGQGVQVVSAAAVPDHVVLETGTDTGLWWWEEGDTDVAVMSPRSPGARGGVPPAEELHLLTLQSGVADLPCPRSLQRDSGQTPLSEDSPAAFQSWCPTHGTGRGGLFQTLLGFQVTPTWFQHTESQLCVLRSLR